jgi:hypothetical protein
MPPTFVYLMALTISVCFACLVWLAVGLMALIKRNRALSRRLSLAMLATFPFVFVYQVIAAPVVAGVLLIAWAFWKILEPGSSTMTENPLVVVISLGTAFLAISMMLGMSLAGFYEGWCTGWAYGSGRSLREVLPGVSALRLLRHLATKTRSKLTWS